jgi:hypothetical protein
VAEGDLADHAAGGDLADHADHAARPAAGGDGTASLVVELERALLDARAQLALLRSSLMTVAGFREREVGN